MQTSKYELATHPLLEPVIILPSQFFGNAAGDLARKSGEHRLLWAVLADAIHCFQTLLHATSSHGQQLFNEAEWWLMHETQPASPSDGRQEGFAFEAVCAALGLDPNYLRAGLRRWRTAQERGRASRRRAGVGSDFLTTASTHVPEPLPTRDSQSRHRCEVYEGDRR